MSDPINREHLNEITGGDEEFAQELLVEYLQSTTEIAEELRQQVDSPDCEKIRSLAHSIKGSSLSVGADGISQAAREIEDNARLGSVENLAASFSVIEENLAALRQLYP